MPRPALYTDAERLRYVAEADAWVKAQAARLRVRPDEVRRAVATGLLPERIEALGSAAFAAELTGRSTIPRDVGVLKALRRIREYWAQDRIAAE